MSYKGLFSGDEILQESVKDYLAERYQTHPKIGEQFSKDIDWAPTLHLETNMHRTIVVEVSQTPYPEILRLKYAEVVNVTRPVQIYCACPEEVYEDRANRKEFAKLLSHGYGIIVINENGQASEREPCVPLVQHIPKKEFLEKIGGITGTVRVRLLDAFEKYQRHAREGVGDLRELIETIVVNTAKSAVRMGLLTSGVPKRKLADILDDMTASGEFKDAAAAIGGVRSFVKDYGNLGVHKPKNKLQAYRTYRDCRYAFIEGIRHIKNFKVSMNSYGIKPRA